VHPALHGGGLRPAAAQSRARLGPAPDWRPAQTVPKRAPHVPLATAHPRAVGGTSSRRRLSEHPRPHAGRHGVGAAVGSLRRARRVVCLATTGCAWCGLCLRGAVAWQRRPAVEAGPSATCRRSCGRAWSKRRPQGFVRATTSAALRWRLRRTCCSL